MHARGLDILSANMHERGRVTDDRKKFLLLIVDRLCTSLIERDIKDANARNKNVDLRGFGKFYRRTYAACSTLG